MPHRWFLSLCYIRGIAARALARAVIRALRRPDRGTRVNVTARQGFAASVSPNVSRTVTRDSTSQRVTKTPGLAYPIDDNNKYGESVYHLPHVRCCDCRLSGRWRCPLPPFPPLPHSRSSRSRLGRSRLSSRTTNSRVPARFLCSRLTF